MALSQMNQVAQMQSKLAANVQDRMQQIEMLINEKSTNQTAQPVDEEVVYWRQVIATLSAPVGNSIHLASNPPHGFNSSPRQPSSEPAPFLPSRGVIGDACVPPKMRLRIQRRMRKLKAQAQQKEQVREQSAEPLLLSLQKPPSRSESTSRRTNNGTQETAASASLCTSCWEPVNACKCRISSDGGKTPAVLCQKCWDVPCVCSSPMGEKMNLEPGGCLSSKSPK